MVHVAATRAFERRMNYVLGVLEGRRVTVLQVPVGV